MSGPVTSSASAKRCCDSRFPPTAAFPDGERHHDVGRTRAWPSAGITLRRNVMIHGRHGPRITAGGPWADTGRYCGSSRHMMERSMSWLIPYVITMNALPSSTRMGTLGSTIWSAAANGKKMIGGKMPPAST